MNKQENRRRIAELIGSVRGLFHLLREVGTAAHANLGINASMRGVMESLSEGGPRTVSQLARARPVSRQHIQRIVDDLREQGLVRLEPNPAHKGSPMVALSPKGVPAFGSMMRKELALLDRVGARLKMEEIEIAVKSLDRFRSAIILAAPSAGRRTTGPRASKG